jgi:hypothetical protein
MKKILFLITLVFTTNTYAQDLFFEYSKSISKFDFETNQYEKLNIDGQNANSFNIGLEFKKNNKLGIGFNIAYDENNAKSIVNQSKYIWKTGYISSNGLVNYDVLNIGNKVNINSEFKIGASHIIHGNQYINDIKYNIKNHSEFKGLFLNYGFSLGLIFKSNSKYTFRIAYNYDIKNRISKTKTDSKINKFKNSGFSIRLLNLL